MSCVYLCRSITLDNQLVVLATTAADAGRYHVEAVNDMTGENATSPAVYLSISGEKGLRFFVCLFNEADRRPKVTSEFRRKEEEMQLDPWW